MDFVILKVNGRDLFTATHDEAIEAFRNAQEPIIVEVARRSVVSLKESSVTKKPIESLEKSPSCSKNGYSQGVQTDLSVEAATLAAAMTAATLTTEDIRAALSMKSHILISSETVYSSSASGLLDIAELDTEEDGDDDQVPDGGELYPPDGFTSEDRFEQMNEDEYASAELLKVRDAPCGESANELGFLQFHEIQLCRNSPNEKFGLTLCYRHTVETGEFGAIYVGEIEPDTPASRCANIRIGDRIVQIGGELVSSRSQVVQLFTTAHKLITLLVARSPVADTLGANLVALPEEKELTFTQQECPDFMNVKRSEQDSALGITTDDSMRTGKSSEQEIGIDSRQEKRDHAQVYSACTSEAFEGTRKDNDIHHPLYHIDEELINVGRLMQSLALHCRQLVSAKLDIRDGKSSIAGRNKGLFDNQKCRSPTTSHYEGELITVPSRQSNACKIKSDNDRSEDRISGEKDAYGEFIPKRTTFNANHNSGLQGKQTARMTRDLSRSGQTSAYCTGESSRSGQNPKGQIGLRLWKGDDHRTAYEDPDVASLSDLGGSLLSLSAIVPSSPNAFPNTNGSIMISQHLKSSMSPNSNWSIDESIPSAQRFPSVFSQPVSNNGSRDGLVTVPGASESGSESLNRSRPSGISNISSSDSLYGPDRTHSDKQLLSLMTQRNNGSAFEQSLLQNMTNVSVVNHKTAASKHLYVRDLPQKMNQHDHNNWTTAPTARELDRGQMRTLVNRIPPDPMQRPIPFSLPTVSTDIRIPQKVSQTDIEPYDCCSHPYEIYDRQLSTRLLNVHLGTINHPLEQRSSVSNVGLPKCDVNDNAQSNIYETPYASVTIEDDFPPNKHPEPEINKTNSPPLTDFSNGCNYAPAACNVQYFRSGHALEPGHNLHTETDLYTSLFSAFKQGTYLRDEEAYNRLPFTQLADYYKVACCKANSPKVHEIGGNVMEWVVKRRPDGTRYVTRRPIKNRILKERAKRIAAERCELTTDEDATGERRIDRTGRYRRTSDKPRTDKRKRRPNSPNASSASRKPVVQPDQEFKKPIQLKSKFEKTTV